jgi:hypothetical protein
MPSGNEEIIVRGSSGETMVVTSTGVQIQASTSGCILAGAIVCTTADPGSPVVGQIWFRTDL